VGNWLNREGNRQLCILGDFGSGKTTYLTRLFYRLAFEYLNGSSSKIPMLFKLREYQAEADYAEVVQKFMAVELASRAPLHVFESLLEQGKFVLLLDGFDEMGSLADESTRKANYIKLAPLTSGASKVVITCRPAYFLNPNELHAVFSQLELAVGFHPHSSRGEPHLMRPMLELTRQLHQNIKEYGVGKLKSTVSDALSSTTSLHNICYRPKPLQGSDNLLSRIKMIIKILPERLHPSHAYIHTRRVM
jgi:hypothetical protein